jgi:hypothetical protein
MAYGTTGGEGNGNDQDLYRRSRAEKILRAAELVLIEETRGHLAEPRCRPRREIRRVPGPLRETGAPPTGRRAAVVDVAPLLQRGQRNGQVLAGLTEVVTPPCPRARLLVRAPGHYTRAHQAIEVIEAIGQDVRSYA